MPLSEKFLVIYVYYEIKNFQKNQSNLSFFLRHGVCNKNWKKINMDYLFIINGHQSEVLIPEEPNIFVLKEDNCFDFEGYNNGVKFMEDKLGGNLSEFYDYVFFMNCYITGPFMEDSVDTHWILPYYNKIQDEKSVICSNIITNLPQEDVGGPGLRVSTYNFLLKIDF